MRRRTPAERTAPTPRPILITASALIALTMAAGPARPVQETQAPEAPSATAAETPEAPPCASPEHHQFDFWIGNWDVRDADGEPQGTNDVTSVFGGCVLQEHWRGAGGSTGSSFNIYDAPRGVWHQTWVDSHGQLLLLDGGLDGKDMVLSGRRPSTKDPSVEVLDEIRWTPLDDGRVRQLWRASKDGGKTWVTVFDGYYSKKGS